MRSQKYTDPSYPVQLSAPKETLPEKIWILGSSKHVLVPPAYQGVSWDKSKKSSLLVPPPILTKKLCQGCGGVVLVLRPTSGPSGLPTCHPARSLQLIGIRPIRSGAIIAHECDRKQARDPTFITGRRSFFSWRRTGTIIRRVMAGVVMEGEYHTAGRHPHTINTGS